MKYLVILVVVILFTRIDYLLGLFDKASDRINNVPADVEVTGSVGKEVIPVSQDRNLQRTTRDTLFALLEDFKTSPVADIRNRSMEILAKNPTMFNEKLDKELESRVFQWREHLNNNEPEVVNFMLDLLNVLKGENQEMVRRFFSLWMDINMEHFIAAYSRTKDSNCTIATTFGENIPEEEKVNEYVERLEFLNAYLAKEKNDPAHKALATNCALQLKVTVDRLAPPALPQSEPPPEEASSTTVFPDPSATITP